MTEHKYNERAFINIFKAGKIKPHTIGSYTIPGLWYYGDIDLEADELLTFAQLCDVLDKMKEKGVVLVEVKIEDAKAKKKFKPGDKITSDDLINAKLLKIDGLFIDEGNRITEISCNYGRSMLSKPVKPLSWYKKLKRVLSKLKRSDLSECKSLMSDVVRFLNETGEDFKNMGTVDLLKNYDLEALGYSPKLIEYQHNYYTKHVDINKLAKAFIIKHNLEHLI